MKNCILIIIIMDRNEDESFSNHSEESFEYQGKRIYRGSGSDENESRQRISSFSQPNESNNNEEENKNEGNNNQGPQHQNHEPQPAFAQLIDFMIRYKRTLPNQNEDGKEFLEEEEDFTTVKPVDIELVKHLLVFKAVVNQETNNLDVTLDLSALFQVFKGERPELKVVQIYQVIQHNNKKYLLEVSSNQQLQYLIQVTATRSAIQSELSSLLSDQIPNPEDQRYQLNLDLKMTLSKEAQELQYLNQIESDGESSTTARFTDAPVADHAHLPQQQVPHFNKDQDQVTDQNANLSENTPGSQVNPEAQIQAQRERQVGNQLGVEARLQRMEHFLMNFAQNINLTFGNPVNQPQPINGLNVQDNYSTSLGGGEGPLNQENINARIQPNDFDRDIEGDFLSNSGIGETPDNDFLYKPADEKEEDSRLIQRRKMPERPQLRPISSMNQPLVKPKKLVKQPTEPILPYNYTQSSNQQIKESNGPDDQLHQQPQPTKMMHQNSMPLTRLSELNYPIFKPQNSTLPPINEMCEQRQQTDLIYLSSNPLIKKNENGQKVSNQNLHIQKEIDEITSAVKQTNRHFNFKSQIGSKTNLTQALINGTNILHISCHGQVLQSQKESSSLLFEPSEINEQEQLGQASEVKELDIIDALNHIHPSIKMVFLSACHSESVGKIFKQKGIPIVIAVDQQTKIYDEVCIVFAKYLYEKLLNGATPRMAFEYADSLVRQEKKGLFFCCCNHPHDKECPWLNGIGKTKDNPHTLHKQEGICDCKDKEFQKELKG